MIIKRWLITKTEDGYTVDKKEYSIHMPINRMLDKPGFYALGSIKVNKTNYVYTYDDKEHETRKSKILLMKSKRRLVDLDDSDEANLDEIVRQVM